MDTRAATTQATRQRILDAALDELVAVGGDAVSVHGVAARADFALRTLYNHFPNRDALLSAAFAQHWHDTRALVERVDVPDAAPDQQLHHVVAAYYTRYAQMGPRLTALLALRDFPEVEEQVRAIRAWRREVICRIVQRARQQGTLTITEPAAVALAFTMTSHTAWQAMINELDNTDSDPAQVASRALSTALFGARLAHAPDSDTDPLWRPA